MARFKPIHRGVKLLPVDFDRQIAPGTFDHALELSAFEARYRNDASGASAYAPSVLLKIILLAYSRGLVSSRRIAAACRESVLFMAVSGDAQPHFTTLAAFVNQMGDLTAKLFSQVLHDKSPKPDKPKLFWPEDFTYDPERQTCRCPAGKSLYRSGTGTIRNGYESSRFKGTVRDCGPCPLRAECLRKAQTTRVRQVAFFHRKAPAPESAADRMRAH